MVVRIDRERCAGFFYCHKCSDHLCQLGYLEDEDDIELPSSCAARVEAALTDCPCPGALMVMGK